MRPLLEDSKRQRSDCSAASSFAELILNPEDNLCIAVSCKFCVLFKDFCVLSDNKFVLIPNAMIIFLCFHVVFMSMIVVFFFRMDKI